MNSKILGEALANTSFLILCFQIRASPLGVSNRLNPKALFSQFISLIPSIVSVEDSSHTLTYLKIVSNHCGLLRNQTNENTKRRTRKVFPVCFSDLSCVLAKIYRFFTLLI